MVKRKLIAPKKKPPKIVQGSIINRKKSSFNKGGRPASYDWDVLLDGKMRMLVWGKDYDCTPKAFRTQAYTQARKRKKKITVRIEDKNIYIYQRTK